MSKFRGSLKKRLIRWIITTIGAAAVILISFLRYRSTGLNGYTESFMGGFQIGMFTAAALIAVWNIFIYSRALKSKEALRKLYIKETDERDEAIKNKVTYMGFWITIGALMVASVIVGFYSVLIFKTLLAVLAFMCITGLICKLYYYKIM